MFSCFNENASARSWDISCGERDAGSEAKSRRRAEMRKGWLDGNCLDLVVLVRSLSLPLAKIKVIVLTTLVYDNTRRQFSKRIIFKAFMNLQQSTKNSMSLLYRIHGFSCLATTR